MELPPIKDAPACLEEAGDRWIFSEFEHVLVWLEELAWWFWRWVGFRQRLEAIDGPQEYVSHVQSSWRAFVEEVQEKHRLVVAEWLRTLLARGESLRRDLEKLRSWFPPEDGRKLEDFVEWEERMKDPEIVRAVHGQLRRIAGAKPPRLRAAGYLAWLELLAAPVPAWLTPMLEEANTPLPDPMSLISWADWQATMVNADQREFARAFFNLLDGTGSLALGQALREVLPERGRAVRSAFSTYRWDLVRPPAACFLEHCLREFTNYSSNYAAKLIRDQVRDSAIREMTGENGGLIEPDESESVDDRTICEELLNELEQNEPLLRTILDLRSLGFSESEMAETLGLDEKVIHNGLAKALRHAKKWLLDHGYKEEDFSLNLR